MGRLAREVPRAEKIRVIGTVTEVLTKYATITAAKATERLQHHLLATKACRRCRTSAPPGAPRHVHNGDEAEAAIRAANTLHHVRQQIRIAEQKLQRKSEQDMRVYFPDGTVHAQIHVADPTITKKLPIALRVVLSRGPSFVVAGKIGAQRVLRAAARAELYLSRMERGWRSIDYEAEEVSDEGGDTESEGDGAVAATRMSVDEPAAVGAECARLGTCPGTMTSNTDTAGGARRMSGKPSTACPPAWSRRGVPKRPGRAQSR